MPPTISAAPFDVKIGEDDPRTFKVRVTRRIQLRLMDITLRTDIGNHERMFEYCLAALVGWSGLRDEEGKEIPFVDDMDVNLRRISTDDLYRLTKKIAESAQLTETDRKN